MDFAWLMTLNGHDCYYSEFDDEFALVYWKKQVVSREYVDVEWENLNAREKKGFTFECHICQWNVWNLRGEPSLNGFDCSISYGVEAASGRKNVFIRCFKRVVLFVWSILLNKMLVSGWVWRSFDWCEWRLFVNEYFPIIDI